MDLIVETDIGHDPDDFFAISYLIAAGVNVRAILISPGDPDQIAIARLLCAETGLNIPIGTSKLGRTKRSSGSIHHDLLKKYNYPLDAAGDGLGEDILEDVVRNYPESELFVIGPVSSLGKYIKKHPGVRFKCATMQGGFLPYSLYEPEQPHPDFLGKDWMPTFNLNGDRPAGLTFLGADIPDRRMVGKNVCHTVIFDRDKWVPGGNHAAAKLFDEAADLYLARHDSKKFHDPTAAVCHLHPEVGTWFQGSAVKREGGWTTVPGGDSVLADLDRDLFWHHLMSRT